MPKETVEINSEVKVKFSLKNESGDLMFGENSGKIETIFIKETEALFDLFKCLIGKEKGYEGKFIVNQIKSSSNIEELSIESLPPYLTFKKGTIIKLGSNNKKFGFIKDINDKIMILETEKPFRQVKSILNVSILDIQNK